MDNVTAETRYELERPDSIVIADGAFRHGQILLMQPLSMRRKTNGTLQYEPEFYVVIHNRMRDRFDIKKIDWNIMELFQPDRYRAFLDVLDPVRDQIIYAEMRKASQPVKEAAHV